MITSTEIRKGAAGNKKGWCFSVFFDQRPYPNITSALYKTKKETASMLEEYISTNKLESYGSAE